MSERLALTMLSGSFEYDSEDSLTVLRGYLAEHSPAISPTLIVYEHEDDTPSLAALEETDVLLVFTRRLNTAGTELERFKNYCADGRPLVGVRTASHAFQNWLDFDRDLLGGNYEGHYGSDVASRIDVADGAGDHPVLTGVLPFESQGSLYKNTPLADDTSLLLTGRSAEHCEPVAWTRQHSAGQRGRIFYTSLGHQKDFWELDFLRLIGNAIHWVAGST